MRVEVYWNFHKKLYSVRALDGPNKGRVIGHKTAITLADATLTVQPAGRAKVLRERKKNVHAFVRGEWLPAFRWLPSFRLTSDAVGVGYNPYQWSSFMHIRSDGSATPITSARTVYLYTSGPEGDVRSNMRAHL